MCGIAGIVGTKSGSQERAASMLDALRHRGPNDEGTHVWDDAIFGHRRLSIFDLSAAGHQPMLSKDGQIGVVLNGAIYNFRPLRAELEAAGYEFVSETDTEVLIHGYLEWGIDELTRRIDGMFAIGIWDDRRRTLFLLRDRLGVKPLVIAEKDGELAFASTIRALRQAGYCDRLDRQGVAEYLEFGFLTDRRSIYQGIKKVPAATLVEWHDGKITQRKYWTLDETKDSKMSFDEAVEETERLFLKAVEKRLQADVPIGALLSGGIDSSLVCWAVAKLGGDVTAFTVGVPGDEWDESNIAVGTAKKLGIRHQILEMSGSDKLNIDGLIRAYAEPFACASALGMLEISQRVAQSATVLLTGDGGDDIFLGYPEHLNFWAAENLARNTPQSLGSLARKAASLLPNKGIVKRASSFLGYAYGGLGAITQVRDGLPVYRENNLLGDRLSGVEIEDREIEFSSGRDLLSEFLAYDRDTRFVGEYLPKVDGGSMLYALEARSPFLDIPLWEMAAKLPFSIRMRDRSPKAVLREIVRRRISPALAVGKKQGFGVPVQRWLTGKWKDAFIEMMSDSLLEREGWIRSDAVLKLLESAGKQNWAPRQLWFILVLEAWLRFENE